MVETYLSQVGVSLVVSNFLEVEVVSGHWVGEGPLVLHHPTTRVSTEASFVLLITGHGNVSHHWVGFLVTLPLRKWSRLSLWLSCLIWKPGLCLAM